ncbi:hypothetical protein BsIDN1_16340 [Bacillus safensis]|uniref:Uncharacterized protein n=1 Tax=Bacillus safensis TaxID=561879 RepID=A0A5S9M8Z1_BACIA|nr:hypothetical protein BsIDN1_16340 [Bacillus safensis]
MAASVLIQLYTAGLQAIFFIDPNQGWPIDQDGAMIPILQIYLPEVPGGMNGFNECKLIQIFS